MNLKCPSRLSFLLVDFMSSYYIFFNLIFGKNLYKKQPILRNLLFMLNNSHLDMGGHLNLDPPE